MKFLLVHGPRHGFELRSHPQADLEPRGPGRLGLRFAHPNLAENAAATASRADASSSAAEGRAEPSSQATDVISTCERPQGTIAAKSERRVVTFRAKP